MFDTEAYEEFARPLRGRSASAIRKLAESEGIKLPNFTDRELLIRELFAASRGLTSPTAPRHVDSPAASAESPVPSAVDPVAAGGPAAIPMRSVRPKRPQPYYCCGRAWTSSSPAIPVTDLTDAQWARLEKDSNLFVRDEV